MKKIFFILFIFISTITAAQSKDYLLSTDGIGALKLGMPLSDLEKILQKKITLKVIDVDPIALTEKIKAKYKNIDVEINLIKRQDGIVVDGITSNSNLCKTTSGIGVGSDQLEIINAYDDYNVDLLPVYEGTDNPVKSKTKKNILVKQGAEGYAILFHLINNKVVSFEIFPDFDDEE